MSKEEILDRKRTVIMEDDGVPFKLKLRIDCLEAMDEYAKEVSIGFKKWSDTFYIETGFDTDENIYYSHVSHESEEKFTGEQLFTQYIKSSSK